MKCQLKGKKTENVNHDQPKEYYQALDINGFGTAIDWSHDQNRWQTKTKDSSYRSSRKQIANS